MRIRWIIPALVVMIGFPGAIKAAPEKQKIEYGGITIEAKKLSFFTAANKVVADGQVVLTSEDKAAGSKFMSSASRVTVIFAAKGSKAEGVEMIRQADFVGPVYMTQLSAVASPAAGTSSTCIIKTMASADNAVYKGDEKRAYLTGNVKITRDDPTTFQVPAHAEGDTAMVNLNSNAGPDEPTFEISSVNGMSRIQAVPIEKKEVK